MAWEKRQPKPRPGSECQECFGCGQLCTRCTLPINACIEARHCNDLDTEEMTECIECRGTGVVLEKETACA
jgi:hypothetical protein